MLGPPPQLPSAPPALQAPIIQTISQPQYQDKPPCQFPQQIVQQPPQVSQPQISQSEFPQQFPQPTTQFQAPSIQQSGFPQQTFSQPIAFPPQSSFPQQAFTSQPQYKPQKKVAPAIESINPINQNKNPNFGFNFKSETNLIGNIEKANENFRNISNIIPKTLPQSISAKSTTPPNLSPKVSNEMINIPEEDEERQYAPVVPNTMDDEDLEQICGEHDKIVGIILEEEEEMIAAHKQHVDEIDEISRLEKQLISEVDKPGSDIEEYTLRLESTLANKMEAIISLRKKLSVLRSHLEQEKELSKKFFEQQNEINDVFDLNGSEKKDDEDVQMLTNGLDIPMFN